ncbi:MAG: CBS domain-containing protein [Desulfovibrionaceae bacterium]|nr:CBS domain-containing protein [Desulfovibrionaceae bacterium]
MSTVKELMIPVSEYVSVREDATLLDALMALEDHRQRCRGDAHAHRDLLVFGADGALCGKLTMLDVFRALEPAYRAIETGAVAHDTLTSEYVAKVFKEFNLWAESLYEQCDKVVDLTVAEIMHRPGPGETLDEADQVEKAVHLFISGVHQPLLVRRQGQVVGVLRLGDVFEAVRRRIISCKAK